MHLAGLKSSLNFVDRSSDELNRERQCFFSACVGLQKKLQDFINTLTAKQNEVSALRRQACEFDAESLVNRDVLQAGIKLILSKADVLVQSIAKVERQNADLNGRQLVLEQTIKSALINKEHLQKQLSDVLEVRERFVKNKTELYQKLSNAESSQTQASRLLEVREEELLRLKNVRNHQSRQLKCLLQREYEGLDLVRQDQVAGTKAESELGHCRKRIDYVQVSFGTTSKRLESVASSIEQKTGDLSLQRSELLHCEKLLGETIERMKHNTAREAKFRSELQNTDSRLAPLIEECHGLSLQSESCESDVFALRSKVTEAETSFALTSQESDRMRYTVAKEDERKLTLLEKVRNLSDEIDRIRRVNSAAGRQPILIGANGESCLLGRLRMNEFLMDAHTQPDSLPLMVNKISELVGVLSTSQSNAEAGLASLGLLTSHLTNMRQTTVEACDQISDLRAFKARFLTSSVSNDLRGYADRVVMCFDALRLDKSDVLIIHHAISDLDGINRIARLSLCKNSLRDDAFSILALILNEFSYLCSLDLRENNFSPDLIELIAPLARAMSGITSVDRIVDPTGVQLQSHSGKVIRLLVDLRMQSAEPTRTDTLICSQYEPISQITEPGGCTSSAISEATAPNPFKLVVMSKAARKRGATRKAYAVMAQDKGAISPYIEYQSSLGERIAKKELYREKPGCHYVQNKTVPIRVKLHSSSRQSSSTDSSFDRQLAFSHVRVANKANRLGINYLPREK